MSVKEKLTIAVLMRFVITPKDPTTAHVNQDMKGTEIIAQVVFSYFSHFECHGKHCCFYFSMIRCSL